MLHKMSIPYFITNIEKWTACMSFNAIQRDYTKWVIFSAIAIAGLVFHAVSISLLHFPAD